MEERANEAETKTQTIIVFLLLSAKEILHLHGKGLSIYLHEFSVTATWETHLRYFELCMGEKIAFLILFSCYIAYYYQCFVRVFVIHFWMSLWIDTEFCFLLLISWVPLIYVQTTVLSITTSIISVSYVYSQLEIFQYEIKRIFDSE